LQTRADLPSIDQMLFIDAGLRTARETEAPFELRQFFDPAPFPLSIGGIKFNIDRER
jgi:hypothetical protein